MTAQGRTTSKNTSSGPKRLDFAVRHDHSLDVKPSSRPTSKATVKSTPKPVANPVHKPTAKSNSRPAAKLASEPAKTTPKTLPKTAPDTPRKPLMPNRGHFIDFVPSHPKASLKASKPASDRISGPARDRISEPTSDRISGPARDRISEPTSDLSPESISNRHSETIPANNPEAIAVRSSVSHETIEISPAEEPRKARRPISPRGFMMDFMRRPKHHATPVEEPEPEPEPEPKPEPRPASRRPDSDFESELDSIDELSSTGFNGLGDDIDAIEAEIEAAAESETSDFIKEPKPLFEDPLVRLSKAREERQSQKKAAEEERLREEVLEEAREQAKRSPYAAMYNGDRSPFLSSVNVEKRPLSNGSSSTLTSSRTAASVAPKTTAKKSPSNFFSSAKSKLHTSTQKTTGDLAMKKQLADDAKEIHRQTMMMSTPETKSHKAALAIAVILTIILGAGVGAVIYLIFFQNN